MGCGVWIFLKPNEKRENCWKRGFLAKVISEFSIVWTRNTKTAVKNQQSISSGTLSWMVVISTKVELDKHFDVCAIRRDHYELRPSFCYTATVDGHPWPKWMDSSGFQDLFLIVSCSFIFYLKEGKPQAQRKLLFKNKPHTVPIPYL